MGLLLILIGIVVWAYGFALLGLLLVIVGLVLLFAPGPNLYGYSYWRGRRGPP